jgi:hypothetical protein
MAKNRFVGFVDDGNDLVPRNAPLDKALQRVGRIVGVRWKSNPAHSRWHHAVGSCEQGLGMIVANDA